MKDKKEYLVSIAASIFASDDEEAKRIAYEYAQYLRLMPKYKGNEAGIYKLTDVSADNTSDWRRIIS